MPTTASVPVVIFVLGGPGSGKGTQCARLVEQYGFAHLSAEDLVRAERQKNGETGDVAAEVTVRLLKEAMEVNSQAGMSKFLIDGFPGDMENVKTWNEAMSENCFSPFTLYLDCPKETMDQRLLARNSAGDNAETVAQRFETFTNASIPIINIIEKEGKLRKVDSSGDPDTVFAAVRDLFLSEGVVDKTSQVEPEPEPEAAAEAEAMVGIIPENSDYKKRFHACVDSKVKQAFLPDAEAPEAESKAEEIKETKARFWDLQQGEQEKILSESVKEALFNPTPDANGCVSATWSISSATTIFSISGGYHVTCTEVRTDGTTVTHAAYVNSYGVLERIETPLLQKTTPEEPPAQEEEEGGCVVC